MKIAICEDNKLQLNEIVTLCKNYFTTKKLNFSIDTFNSGESFLFSYEDKKDYDVLILDIQMKSLTGIDLAKKLRGLGDNICIIFTTAISDYVFEGYGVQAVDYIIKPINNDKLFKALDRALEHINKKDIYIIIESQGETKKIKEKNIYFIESIGRNTIINLNTSSFETNMGISHIETILNSKTFYKCHRSYLVNIYHINTIHKTELTLDNGKTTPIARGKWQELNKLFIQYYRSNKCNI
ncbi:response regulator transcription factor [Sedimentibacter sp. zth1]|uniref:LytR/AlgR family response regulator transcription factor n=1 Tax=Sedimentibacter sp. zth1 TaxID=2816908 RepID=UPI001A910558|nr:LytTR family DNA-binding domain-containing protein [Sedimentibacter sp. zth1]QSX07218.1 response regulator transcription factor [Sedimentibacter sp. zth1]